MSLKLKIGLCCVALLVAFAAGRYGTPERVRTEIKYVEVEKKTEDKTVDADKHKETKTTVVTKPDGSKESTTVVTEDSSSKTNDHKTDESSRTKDQTKEIIYAQKRLSISALVGANSLFPPAPIIYGGHVTYSLFGPINIGAWGLSNLTFGISLGVSL